jgi:hypothetical protein
MTERDTIDTPEDRALSRAIFKKIDELRSRRHLATDEAARRAITDHINVLVKNLRLQQRKDSRSPSKPTARLNGFDEESRRSLRSIGLKLD